MSEKKIANPVKSFQYAFNINGIEQAKIQSVEVDDIEIQADTHFDAGEEIKTPGMPKIGDINLEKLIQTDGTDNAIWTWMMKGYDIKTGRQSAIANVKRDGTISLLDGEGNAVRIWVVEGAWVNKFKMPKLGDGEAGNAIDKVTLKIDKIYPQKI